MECTFTNRSSTSYTGISYEDQEPRNEKLRRGVAFDIAQLKERMDAVGVHWVFETSESETRHPAKLAARLEDGGFTVKPIEICVQVTRADGECVFAGHEDITWRMNHDLDLLGDIAKCLPDGADAAMWEFVLRTWLAGYETGYCDGDAANDC